MDGRASPIGPRRCERRRQQNGRSSPLTKRGGSAGYREGSLREIIDVVEADSLVIALLRDRPWESDGVHPGVIADRGKDGSHVRFEILHASSEIASSGKVDIA